MWGLNTKKIEKYEKPVSDPISTRIQTWDIHQGAVKNVQQFSTNRAYTAIVAEKKQLGSNIDYDDIQQAIDAVEVLGGGTVFIKSGTYYPRSPIILKSNVNLLGESPNTTIIDLSVAGDLADGGIQARDVNIKASLSGTVAVTNGSATVTGTSTDFIAIGTQSGDYIQIRGNLYEILAVASNTSLTLTNAYQGVGESSLAYDIRRVVSNISVSGIRVTNGKLATTAGAGFGLFGAYNIQIFNVTVDNCTIGIDANKLFYSVIRDNKLVSNSTYGVVINAVSQTYIQRNVCAGNDTGGIQLATTLSLDRPTFIQNNICNSNDDYGIHLFVGNNGVISGNSCSSNGVHGIYGEGVTYNIIKDNNCSYNGTDGIHLTNRISVQSEYNIVLSNICANNADDGIEFTSGCDNSNLCHNVTVNNSGTDIVDSGSGNTVFDNT